MRFRESSLFRDGSSGIKTVRNSCFKIHISLVAEREEQEQEQEQDGDSVAEPSTGAERKQDVVMRRIRM